jgi:hypothetical protein
MLGFLSMPPLLEQARIYQKPDGRVILRWGWPIRNRRDLITVEQEEHERMLQYTRAGRLSQVVFPDAEHVDLRDLPKQDLVTPVPRLVELFDAEDIIPVTGEELLARK